MANASIFDQINTGDILSNIGNHGLQSEEVASIFIAMNEAERNKARAEEAKVKQAQERKIIVISSTIAGFIVLSLLIYLINLKLNYHA